MGIISFFREKISQFEIKRSAFWLLLFGMTLFFHLHNNYNQDEGVVLNGAWSLLNGQVLYRDFIEFIPPGAFYIVFWIWKIFGANFVAADLVSIILVFLSAVGLHKITSIFREDNTKYAVAGFFIVFSSWWPIINHNVFSLTLLIWSCYYFLLGLRSEISRDYFLSGMFASASILILHQKGVALLFAEVAFLIGLVIAKKSLQSLKSIAYTLVGLFPLLLLLLWPLKDIYFNLVQYPLFGYMSVNRIPYNYLVLSFVTLFICVLLLVIKRTKDLGMWFLILAQLVLLLSCYPLPDLYHLSIALFPLIIIIFTLGGTIQKYFDPKVKYVFFVSFVVFSFVYYLNLRSEKRSVYEYVAKYVERSCPEKYLYAGPFSPSIYFDSKKLNATPFSVLISKQSSDGQFLSALEGIKRNAPSCAVLWYPPFLRRFGHNANNVVENYIRSEYVLVDQPMKGMFFIYKKL